MFIKKNKETHAIKNNPFRRAETHQHRPAPASGVIRSYNGCVLIGVLLLLLLLLAAHLGHFGLAWPYVGPAWVHVGSFCFVFFFLPMLGVYWAILDLIMLAHLGLC